MLLAISAALEITVDAHCIPVRVLMIPVSAHDIPVVVRRIPVPAHRIPVHPKIAKRSVHNPPFFCGEAVVKLYISCGLFICLQRERPTVYGSGV